MTNKRIQTFQNRGDFPPTGTTSAYEFGLTDGLHERNSVSASLLDVILGKPHPLFPCLDAYLGFAANANDSYGIGRACRCFDGDVAVDFECAHGRTCFEPSFVGTAMAAMFLNLILDGLADDSPPINEILHQNLSLQPSRSGLTCAYALHDFLEIKEPIDAWWKQLETDLHLELGADFFMCGDIGSPEDDLPEWYLLTSETAIEAALLANTSRGRMMRRYYTIFADVAIPKPGKQWPIMVDPFDGNAGSAELGPNFSPSVRNPISLNYQAVTHSARDSTNGEGVAKAHLASVNGSSRFGRGFYLNPQMDTHLMGVMASTLCESDVKATAIRSQLLARNCEMTDDPTLCKILRNCEGLSGNANGFINLEKLARYLRIAGAAGWFNDEARALGLREGEDYFVTRVTRPGGRRRRSVRVAQHVAQHLCLRAPTLPGRWFRIYHMATARIRHPYDLLRYKQSWSFLHPASHGSQCTNPARHSVKPNRMSHSNA